MTLTSFGRVRGPGLAIALGLSFAACGGSSESGDGAGTGGSGAASGASGAFAGSESGGSTATGGSTSGGSSSGATGGTPIVGGSAGVAGTGDWCADGGCVCSNGLDDDGDGLIDGFDPECTGPYDNDEGSFATGIPGDNRDPKWQDCFFDGNSGAGDDHCRYATECLTGELPLDDPDCTLTQNCIDFCTERTPNGCDCFGCCTVEGSDGTPVDIMTGPTCSLDDIDDEDACPRCVKSTTCGNDCGECELCPGKAVDDLPESCGNDTPPPDGGTPPPDYTCDDGRTVCSEQIPCEGSYYCSLGCCLPVVR